MEVEKKQEPLFGKNFQPWDGRVLDDFTYPEEDIVRWRMMKDGMGNIWYYPQGADKPNIWCGAQRLRRHMRRLANLAQEAERIKKNYPSISLTQSH